MAQIARDRPRCDGLTLDGHAQDGDTPCFDRIARLYRPAEYLTFGPWLERCRFHHLSALAQAAPAPKQALILGDGDGRFLARLLAANPTLHSDAVDLSPAMLRLLHNRVTRIGASDRLTTICADIRTFIPPRADYDLVVTHFVLDCLTAPEAATLLLRLPRHLAPGALWLVSEFQIPAGNRFRAALARTLISGLYAGFRVLTGLAVRQIPPWRSLLAQSGFAPRATRTFLGGLLITELWRFEATAASPAVSHQEMASSFLSSRSTDVPGIDPGPEPFPGPPPVPTPDPAPGPAPEPDPEPYPGPIPAPQPVTRG